MAVELEGGRRIELLRSGQVLAEVRGPEPNTGNESRHTEMPDFMAH